MDTKKVTRGWPKLYEYVLEAVSILGDVKGSPAKSIIDIIRNEFVQNDERFRGGITMNIRCALKYGLLQGELEHRAGRYKLRNINSNRNEAKLETLNSTSTICTNHRSILNDDNILFENPPSSPTACSSQLYGCKSNNSNLHTIKYETRSKTLQNRICMEDQFTKTNNNQQNIKHCMKSSVEKLEKNNRVHRSQCQNKFDKMNESSCHKMPRENVKQKNKKNNKNAKGKNKKEIGKK